MEQLQRVPLAVKWGVGLVFIEDLDRSGDGISGLATAVRTLGRDVRILPTIVADRVRLMSGRWYYEVRVATTTVSGRCSIGFSGTCTMCSSFIVPMCRLSTPLVS